MKDGIRVNGVAPGPIWTPLIPASFSAEQIQTFGSGTSEVPMNRAGQPFEMAPSYVFLASDDSRYMSRASFTSKWRRCSWFLDKISY